MHTSVNMTMAAKASLDSFDEKKEYDVASSTTEDDSTCSDRSSKCSQPVEDSRKSMEVTVTVISLDGVVAKKYQSKSKLPSKQMKTQKAVETTASIVASFSQDISNQKVDFFTHLPSFPIEMSESSSNSNPVVKWPNTNREEKQVLSTVQLTREFHREKTSIDNTSSSTNNRFVPQMCPINISISRHGKLINLGKASLFISGEEKGDATINIPIFSTTKDEKKSNAKKSSVKKVKGSKKKSMTPMMRIKGDSLQFGLKSDAMLRILVSVADHCVDQCEEEESSLVERAKEEIEEPASCVPFNDDDCECVFDDDSIEQDDYEDYIGCITAANESNEVRSLKQQLRNSEDMIQNLQAEHTTTRITQQQEIERLRSKLKQATQNSETLLQELNQSKSQSEIVPFLETRINDFLDELKKKDMEIECLRDEVTEIRQYYRKQVNTLLWDDQDADNTKAANWKAAIGSAALKATKHIRDREVIVENNNFATTQDEEKTNDVTIEGSVADEFLWDNNENVKEGNRAAVNWRAAIGTAALRARQHLLERENRQREEVEEISTMSSEEKNNDAIVEYDKSEEKSDGIVTMEESMSANTEEKNDCDQPLVDNSTEKDSNNTVSNSGNRAANWKNAIGSAFRRDANAEKLTANDKSIVCQ